MKNCVIQSIEDLDFSGTEALNSICTNLSFVGRDMKKFAITSCTENEGKSSMTMQIMMNLARRGKSVVLVDCDLRKSVMMRHFSITMDTPDVLGLAHYLAGYNSLDDIIYQTDVPGAYYIPTGRDVMNPLPLLDSTYFSEMLDELSRRFDMVLVDTPPIGMVIDSAVVAKSCDGTVLVIQYANRRKGEVVDAVRKVEQSGTPVIGCIINRVTVRTFSERNYYKNHYYSYSHYGKSGYGYGYGNSPDKDKD
ncbi:MAG: CpsD/CapB family tyrosine-protein kinase [Clostridia bacterium]|nr:CpsD/CapB family tyrosine-protein kinase [Clostridia bacterium]